MQQKLIDKDYVIAGMMQAGYSREEATMIADVTNNVMNECSDKVYNACKSLREELRAQCFVMAWHALSAYATVAIDQAVKTARDAGAIIRHDIDGEVPK